MNQVTRITGISNCEFFERYAQAGCIGLVGGVTLVERAIRMAERHVCDGRYSNWSHAFLFGERRADGHLWVIESDLQAARKHIRFGVQENRVAKYFDEKLYPVAAVLDFGLSEEKTKALVAEGLEMVANAARYSMRELFGTLIALRKQELRGKENLLAREKSFYCSALVHHLFCKIGVELCPGVNAKHTTPEDIFRTIAPHTKYLIERQMAESRLQRLAQRMRKPRET